MQFRKDINGLRAIAVIAVVLFHFNAAWLPGGFAGVDVFFVISGFLMTKIIFKGLEQNNFSIFGFYFDRGKRIIPALAVLCLVLMVFGWFYLTAFDYRAMVKHIGNSMLFWSNMVYWQEIGYFNAGSHQKWLLHTWSLSAEWQFYILYPLALVVMNKLMSLKALKLTILLGTVLGFVFCIIVTYKWPNPAYFLLPTRVWEMTLGGVAFLYPWTLADKNKKQLEWLGFGLIIVSYFFMSSDNPWPGYLAIIPVMGTFLVIQAQTSDSLVSNNRLLQKMGTWSYSIYLWHWPVVVLFYFQYDNKLVGIALSILLGYLSFTLVEKKTNAIKLLSCCVLCLIPFFTAFALREVSLEVATKLENEREAYRYHHSNPDCNFSPYDAVLKKQIEKQTIAAKCITAARESILLHGDSHVQHLFYGLNHHLGDRFDILQIAAFSCRVNGEDNTSCIASNKLFKQQINTIKPKITIIAQLDGHEKVDWDTYLQKLNGLEQVIILGPSVGIDIFKLRYRGERIVNNWDRMVQTDAFMRAMLLNKYPNVKYVSMKDILCQDSRQSCIFTVDGEYIYADGGHYTKLGSNFVVKKLRQHMAL